MIEEFALELENLESYRIDAMSCYESYLKTGNPMGFHLMLSKLLPALECPHTILTTGPVKKRLITKKARLLLINFLVSVILLGDDIVNIYQSDSDCEDDGKGASDKESVRVRTGLGCKLCVDPDPVGACQDYHSAVIAHVSEPSHMKKVVEKLEKENNIEGLQNFGYVVKTTKKKTKKNQLREGLRNMSTIEIPDVKEDDQVSRVDIAKESGSTPPAKPSQEEGEGQGGSSSRLCWNCHTREKLLKCSGCMRAWYCGQRCQEADWDRHGGYCEARMRKRRLREVD